MKTKKIVITILGSILVIAPIIGVSACSAVINTTQTSVDSESVTYDVSFIGPNPSDKQNSYKNGMFTEGYALHNWIKMTPDVESYAAKWGEPKVTLNKDVPGSISMEVKFDDSASIKYMGDKVNSVSALFTGFSKSEPQPAGKYTFEWKNPSASDLNMTSDNAFFSPAYIAQNWTEITPAYIKKYGAPQVKVVSADGASGTIKVSINFATQVKYNNKDVSNLEKSFSGFKIDTKPPIPPKPTPSEYQFKFVNASADDYLKQADDPLFTKDYAKKHWMQFSNGGSESNIGSMTWNCDATAGRILIGINFTNSIIINTNPKPTYYAQIWFDGFDTKTQSANDYKMSFLSPSKQDLELQADNGLFNDKYILKNWMNVDPRLFKNFGDPAITIQSHDVQSGQITIKVDFRPFVVVDKIKAHSFTHTFNGFYIPPDRNDLFFSWNKVNLPNIQKTVPQVKQMSSQEFTKEFIIIPSGSKMKASDITSSEIQTFGIINGRVKGTLIVHFRFPFKIDSMSSQQPAKMTWTINVTMNVDPNPTPFVEFEDLNVNQKNRLPSSIDDDWIYNNLVKIEDSNGNFADPKQYVDKILLHPIDEDGSIVVSIQFNQLISRIPPAGTKTPENYTTPSKYFNYTIRDLNKNGLPYNESFGYATDSQFYSRYNFDFSDINPHNYSAYIYSFMMPDASNGHLYFNDMTADFLLGTNSWAPAGYGVVSNDPHYKPTQIKGYDNFPDWVEYAQPNQRGITYTPESYDGGFIGQLNTVKSLYGTKTALSIGGANSGAPPFIAITQSKQKANNFINDIIALVEKFGFDQVDLDWEYPQNSDMDNFTTLLKDMKEAFLANPDPDVQNTQISIALGASMTNVYSRVDLGEVAKYIDFFNAMNYDMHGGWDIVSGDATMPMDDMPLIHAMATSQTQVTIDNKTYHLHPEYYNSWELQGLPNTFPGDPTKLPFSCKDTILDLLNPNDPNHKWTTTGVPNSKIVIGAGTYQRGYKVSEASGYKYPVEEIPGYLMHKKGTTGDLDQSIASYGYVASQCTGPDWTMVKNPVTGSSYFWNSKSDIWWSGDTEASIKVKINLAKQYHIAGILTWEVADEYYKDGVMRDDISKQFQNNMSGPTKTEDDSRSNAESQKATMNGLINILPTKYYN